MGLLKTRYAQQQPTSFVTFTKEEQQALQRIQSAVDETKSVRALFQKHLAQIDDHAVAMKASVDEEFQRITDALKGRKEALYAQVQTIIFYVDLSLNL